MQVIGAIIATLILRVLTPHSILHGGHLAAPVLPEHSHALRAFFGAPPGKLWTFCAVAVLQCVLHRKPHLLSNCQAAVHTLFGQPRNI